jgi:ubiquinone/menaquinone biosynthesis C-methylase UbiE
MSLPFADDVFDEAVSVTAIEFIDDARTAVAELFRVARRGATIVVAIRFSRDEDPERAAEMERQRQLKDSPTGAFVAAGWRK